MQKRKEITNLSLSRLVRGRLGSRSLGGGGGHLRDGRSLYNRSLSRNGLGSDSLLDGLSRCRGLFNNGGSRLGSRLGSRSLGGSGSLLCGGSVDRLISVSDEV